jgi:hypothetical protein
VAAHWQYPKFQTVAMRILQSCQVMMNITVQGRAGSREVGKKVMHKIRQGTRWRPQQVMHYMKRA